MKYKGLAIVILYVFLAAGSVSAQSGVSFLPRVDYAVGTLPRSVAVGDFNRDGIPDMAVPNIDSNNVSVLLGKGDGTFQGAVNFSVGPTPRDVAVGDFNGDGILDLAVADAGFDSVSVLLGNGDGTFRAAVNFSVGVLPVSVAVGDFNRDGKLDLAVANINTSNVSVLLGNGDGTFQQAVNFSVGFAPGSVAVGDFNGDGILDLAVANRNTASVLLGNGDGTFQGAVSFGAGTFPDFVAVGDFNGDGILDLAVANSGSNNVSVLLGKGDGTFQGAVNFSVGAQPLWVVVGDFNGDGILDLAVANFDSNNVSILLGNGDGTFQTAVNFAAGTHPVSVAAGDLNRDCKLDLAVANFDSNHVSVLINNTPSLCGTVLTRKRVGNNSEGVTYVTSGHWKNRAVAIDGNDVLSINLGGPNGSSDDSLESASPDGSNRALRGPGWRKIFDVLVLGTDARVPRGILFVPGKNEFLFSGLRTTNLFHTDEFGNPLAPIVLTGLANPTDFALYEGLTWIPADAPKHPNTIAALMIRASDFLAHVIYVHLDGTVEAEVLPQPGTPIQSYICGIAYQPQRPGTLLLSECGGGNYAMDEDGNFLNGGPILPAPAGSGDIESIIVDRFSRVFLGGYDGHLYAYDSNYNRLPTSQDRSYVIGLGIFASSITWNSDTSRFLFLNSNNNTIEAVPLSLRSKHTLFNVDPVRAANPDSISYLGGGQLAIANRTFPRGIQVVNLRDGSEVERLIFLPPTYPAGRAFAPLGAGAFGPDQFIVRVVGDRGALKIVSRTGTPDSSILPNAALPTRFPDLTLSSPVVGGSVQVFDSGSGPRIFTGGTIFDTSGNLLHSIDEAALGVTVGLTQGTWITGNTFAGIDAGTSTVIIFSVP